MLKIEEHHLFRKYLKRLTVKQRVIYQERIKILVFNPRHPILRLHALKGNLSGLYAFSLGGDLRVIFERVGQNHILLHKIGTHNQVY